MITSRKVTIDAGKHVGQFLRRLSVYGVLSACGLLYISPILLMIVGSLKADARVLPEAGGWRGFAPVNLSLENYQDVFARVPFGLYLMNSLLITGSIVVTGLLVNSLAGYALARLRFRGRLLVLGLVLALLIIPLEAIAVPLFYEVTVLSWRDTYFVQVVPFVANAFSIYLFYSFFLSLPKELEEAARMDGAGPWRIFFQIIVPISKPAFAAATIVSFLLYWGLYLWPLLVTTDQAVRPLPLGIATFRTLPPLRWADIMAFAVMMVTPVLIVFILFQRWFVRSVVFSAVKG